MAQGAGGGRPTKYKAAHCKPAKLLAKAGATNFELAQFFEVDTSTIVLWMLQHPKFSTAVKTGRGPADRRTERSLFERANGYTYESEEIHLVDHVIEDTIPAEIEGGKPTQRITRTKRVLRVPLVKHVPPDPTSIIFWLKNRRKDRWRDFKATELSTPPGRPLAMTYVPNTPALLQDYYAKIAQSTTAADADTAAPRPVGPDGSEWEESGGDPDFSPR
jgi:hypothetical protein